MSATITGKVNAFKALCHYYPEVVASLFVGSVGLGLMGVACYNYEKKNGNVRKYMMEYTVVRPDHPLAKVAKKGPDNRYD